ncbi:hypothetical protein Bca4012_019926 [Brassica carinata]
MYTENNGEAPLVIACGGFSGLFPDSSVTAYSFVSATSVPDAVLWCDVQLTKDGVGICFPNVTMSKYSDIEYAYPERKNSYLLNGVPTQDWFTIDFTSKDLDSVFLIQGILSRSPAFDCNQNVISPVQNIATQYKPAGFWLNVQHNAFYAQHNISMSRFLLSVSKTVIIDYLSSPELNFFRNIGSRFGILVPKSYYIWPVEHHYFLPHTTFVYDAHKAGLQVYASGFSNDIHLACDYSYDPLAECLSFMDNGNFSVDGHVAYLREKQGIDVVKAVLYAFKEAGYINATKRVMIQSTNSSVLVDFKKQTPYKTVYQVEETIGYIDDSAIEAIKKFADAVVVSRGSVYLVRPSFFITGQTNIVEKLQMFKLPVYVETFQNDGIITEFPLTAARYKSKEPVLGPQRPASLHACVKPAALLEFVGPLSPDPVFTYADVTEPPLPPLTSRAPPTTIPGPLSTGSHSISSSFLQSLWLSPLFYFFDQH